MTNQKYWEEQHKEFKVDEEAPLLSDQYAYQQNYLKASAEDKRNQKFFKELPIENIVDEDAIKEAKQMGLTAEVFLSGRMTNELVQKMNYMKSKHRTNILLSKWSQDGYFFKQKEVLKVGDDFNDTIERINVNDLTVDEFIETYEQGHKPVIIRGVAKDWPANTEWQIKVSQNKTRQIY